MSKSISKKRLYNEDYIKYGFTIVEKSGIHLPQCVICHTVLSNDSIRLVHLENHLMTNHPGLKNNPIEFFDNKINALNRMKLDSTGNFQVENENFLEASYESSLLIVKNKKPHNIGEFIVKPCLVTACRTVFNEESYNKVSKFQCQTT